MASKGWINGLKLCAAETPLINTRTKQRRPFRVIGRVSYPVVHTSLPNGVTEEIVMPGVTSVQVRLRVTVRPLLPHETLNGWSAVMPDQRRRTESNSLEACR